MCSSDLRTLLAAGYDIEWHIVVLGEVEHSERYQALAAAMLGKAGPMETGVAPIAEPAIPDAAGLEPERPVESTDAGRGGSS